MKPLLLDPLIENLHMLDPQSSFPGLGYLFVVGDLVVEPVWVCFVVVGMIAGIVGAQECIVVVEQTAVAAVVKSTVVETLVAVEGRAALAASSAAPVHV